MFVTRIDITVQGSTCKHFLCALDFFIKLRPNTNVSTHRQPASHKRTGRSRSTFAATLLGEAEAPVTSAGGIAGRSGVTEGGNARRTAGSSPVKVH